MTPLAHHAGEESLAALLLVGGGAASYMVAVSRARLTATWTRLARILRRPLD